MFAFLLFVAFCCLIYWLFKSGNNGLAIFLMLAFLVWAFFSLA